jgi:hypothetical protein
MKLASLLLSVFFLNHTRFSYLPAISIILQTKSYLIPFCNVVFQAETAQREVQEAALGLLRIKH